MFLEYKTIISVSIAQHLIHEKTVRKEDIDKSIFARIVLFITNKNKNFLIHCDKRTEFKKKVSSARIE